MSAASAFPVADRTQPRETRRVEWWRVLENIVSGSVVALVVAAIAWFGTGKLVRRQEARRARHQRDLAAAEELYAVYGSFFSVWKSWEYVRGRDETSAAPVDDPVRRGLLAQAAEVEGRYESLLVRMSLERRLSHEQRKVLWALRFGIKELRGAIRAGRPLGWWRTDDPRKPGVHAGHLRYLAFKQLTTAVAGILVDDTRGPVTPSPAERAQALSEITATYFTVQTDTPLKGSHWAEVPTTSTAA